MNKSDAIEKMIKDVMEIEKQEDINRYKKASEMKKDAVKKILEKLEDIVFNED